MPCTLPASSPPLLTSGSIFTAPNVERHSPSARAGSISCGGGGLLSLPGPASGFWLELDVDVADPTAAAHATRTATTRATLPALIERSIPPCQVAAAGDRAPGVVVFP